MNGKVVYGGGWVVHGYFYSGAEWIREWEGEVNGLVSMVIRAAGN